jgi:hypothetical protein
MKKLFILFLTLGLFTACNNGDNPFAKKANKDKTGTEENGGKDDTKKGGLFGGVGEDEKKNKKTTGDDYENNVGGRSDWTTAQKNKWLDECINASHNSAHAREVCSCVIDKLEKKYPDAKDAENATEAEGTRLAKDCMEDLGITGTGTERDETNFKQKDNEEETNGNRGGSWTKLQREQYIKGCETTARKNPGYTEQQIHSYCDCMTTKVERKYTFLDAAKMTAQDFQTQEWQKAAADCMPRY